MSTPAPQEETTYPTRDAWADAAETARRERVAACRDYYAGAQYDADNEACMNEWLTQVQSGEKSLARNLFDRYQLPEHLRRHAYSTQIAECVDWIADRLAEGFAVDADPEPVAEVVDACLNATPELAAGDTDEDRTVALVLREAGKTGDVPVLVRWDAAGDTCWLEFWDSEQVRMSFTEGQQDTLDEVSVTQVDWREVDGQQRQVTLRRVWRMRDGECVEEVFLHDQGEQWADEPVETHQWGLPHLPWWLLRVQRESLRATRGSSLITTQAMRTADRYNAVEQVSWLIARYNSHGNLVVVGDTAMVQGGDSPIHKDVADVLKFPGGTEAKAVTLPTDPAMIEHQKHTLIDALYGRFGLVRTDQESVSGLGAVSGYALEILNEKSEGTFARVRAQLVKDWKKLLNLVLDCHAVWSTTGGPDTDRPDEEDDAGDLAGLLTDEVGLDNTQRRITVRLGSGWIVDEASARDDFLAGAISRREYLRVKGKSPEQIDEILDEIDEERATGDTDGEGTRRTSTGQAGRMVNNVTTGRRPSSVNGVRIGSR